MKKGIAVVIDLCGGAEYTAGATHVILWVTKEMCRSLLKHMDLFGSVGKRYDSLSEIRFWFGNPEYCGLEIESTDDEKRDCVFETAFEKAQEVIGDGKSWTVLDTTSGLGPDSMWAPGRYTIRTELDELVVSGKGDLHFCCVIKHTDAELKTKEIHRKDVEKWLELIDVA